jgi:hypothetical protein
MGNSRGLRRLIGACLDHERTLDHESGLVDDDRRVVLSRLAGERARFVERLQALGEPGVRATGSWFGLLRELLRGFWVMAGGPNYGDAIAECRRSRSRTEALYEQAIRRSWSQPILPALIEQRDRIRHERRELLALQF